MSEPLSDQEKPPSLEDLDRRLSAARARGDVDTARQEGRQASLSGLGLGMRLATELVAGAAVGTGIGWGIDRLFDSSPWATLVFSVFGWIAGMLNAYRAARGLDDTVGLGASVERSQTSSKDDGKESGGG